MDIATGYFKSGKNLSIEKYGLVVLSHFPKIID